MVYLLERRFVPLSVFEETGTLLHRGATVVVCRVRSADAGAYLLVGEAFAVSDCGGHAGSFLQIS
jgi:hypothetical protein